MIGEKFNRLTVAEFSHRDARQRKFWRCRCDCGGEVTTQTGSLRSGNTKSCGCLGREVRRTLTLLPNNGAVINHIILQYRRHARDRGIEWLLDRETVDRIVRQPCHYCGIAAGNLKRTKNCLEGFAHNGIDRRDAAKPYTLENVVPCCGFCNRAKQTLSDAEFIAWALRVAEQWGSLEAQRLAA